MLAGKKVLITGGMGFIGSHIARRIIPKKAEVTLVDSLIPEYGSNMKNIADIENCVRVNISDVRDKHSLRYLVKDKDIIFNLAGQTSHMDSMKDPFADLEINTKAQLSLLETCRKFNPDCKIIFASTRQLYGVPQYLPVDENHPVQPVDVNGINKASGEMYHSLFHNVYGIKTCILRLTNTYGPGMRIKDARQTFLGIWIKNVVENMEFEVWGGDQLRDFTYIDDCVDAFLLAAERDEANGKVYNLGGNVVIKLKDLADELVKVAGQGAYSIRDFPEERKKIDIGHYYSDFSLIQRELGWCPKVTLNNGLKATVDYYHVHLADYL